MSVTALWYGDIYSWATSGVNSSAPPRYVPKASSKKGVVVPTRPESPAIAVSSSVVRGAIVSPV